LEQDCKINLKKRETTQRMENKIFKTPSNRYHKYVFLSLPISTALGGVLFALTRDWVYIAVAVAIGAVLQNQFEKKRDDADG